MSECIDCGDSVELGQKHCKECNKEYDRLEAVKNGEYKEDPCTCWLGICVTHDGGANGKG